MKTQETLTKTESIRRLRKLKSIIRKVPTKQFNMHCLAKKTKCGTVACVLGWAGLDPDFRKLGLKTRIKDDDCRFNGSVFIAPFFGITSAQEQQLFYTWSNSKSKKERYEAIDDVIFQVKRGY